MNALEWVLGNKEWLFSGVGVVILGLLWRFVWRRSEAPSQTQSQRSGAGSHNIQAGRDVNISVDATPSSQSEVLPQRDPSWKGIEVAGRYFSWAGSGLHGLEDRDGTPCPPQVPEEIRSAGLTPRFGPLDKLAAHLADGYLQVFETDGRSWRRPVLNDGGLLLLAKPDDHAGSV